MAVFNLLPIPPLDGSRIVEGLLSGRLRGNWQTFTQIAPFVLLIVLFAPVLLHVNLFAWPMELVGSLVREVTGR